MATTKTTPTPVISLEDLRRRVIAIQTDICDQAQIIGLALDKVDGDPLATGALLRSISSFNDMLDEGIERLCQALEEQMQKGGV